jgi:hypothetical protein
LELHKKVLKTQVQSQTSIKPFTPAKLIHRKAYRYQKVPSQLPLSNLVSRYGSKSLFKANDANPKLSEGFFKERGKIYCANILINKLDVVP